MEITYAARKTSHEKLFLMFNNTTFLASTKPCFRFSAVLLPLLSFSFIANGFCLVAVLRSKPSTSSQRPNSVRIIHFLVCALSISDTLSLGLQCLMPLTSFFNCGWWGGQLSCDLFGYLSTVVFVWSTWIVVIMAFQRFMATVFPFHYRQHLTTNTVRNSLGVLFLVYSVHTAPPFFGVGEFVLYEDSQFCSMSLTPTGPTDTVFLAAFASEGFLVVGLILFFNIYVIVTLKKTNHLLGRSAGNNSLDNSSSFVSLTKAVALVFCVCYLPFVVCMCHSFLSF